MEIIKKFTFEFYQGLKCIIFFFVVKDANNSGEQILLFCSRQLALGAQPDLDLLNS